MESAGLTTWAIENVDGLITYDVTGKKYDVPFWVLFNPASLVSDDAFESAHQYAAVAASSSVMAPSNAPPMALRVRFASGADLEIRVPSDTNVLAVKRAVAAARGDEAPVTRQRALFSGRLLQDDELLGAAGIAENSIIQITIRPAGF